MILSLSLKPTVYLQATSHLVYHWEGARSGFCVSSVKGVHEKSACQGRFEQQIVRTRLPPPLAVPGFSHCPTDLHCFSLDHCRSHFCLRLRHQKAVHLTNLCRVVCGHHNMKLPALEVISECSSIYPCLDVLRC